MAQKILLDYRIRNDRCGQTEIQAINYREVNIIDDVRKLNATSLFKHKLN